MLRVTTSLIRRCQNARCLSTHLNIPFLPAFIRQTAKYKCDEPRSSHDTQDINSLPNGWTTQINLPKNGKFVPVDSVKAYAGRRITSPLIHDPGAGWGGVRSATRPGRFIPVKETRYGPQRRRGRFGDAKNLLPLPRFDTADCQTRSPYAITTDCANLATE